MSVKTWNGATASIATAPDWSPAGPPAIGDIGVISRGAVLADGMTVDGFTLRLSGNGIGVAPTLELSGTTLGPRFHVWAIFSGSGGAVPTAAINVNGTDVNAGQIVAGSASTTASLQIRLGAPTAELVNTGCIQANPGSTTTVDAGQVVNNGRLVANGGRVELNTQLTGSGRVIIEHGGTVDAGQIVGRGQTVLMHGGTLELGSPFNFLATVQDWASGTTLDLLHTHLTSASVANGVLTLHDGQFTEAQIKLAGSYASSDFHILNQADGSALVTTMRSGHFG